MAFTKEEKILLKKLSKGSLDGFVGNGLRTTGGSFIWSQIKNGVPIRFKEGPSRKFFDGKENIRHNGILHKMKEWITDNEKLEFLRNFGWLMKDSSAKSYSAKFKPTK